MSLVPLSNFLFSLSVAYNKPNASVSAQLRSTMPSTSVILNVRVGYLWCKTHGPMRVILVELYALK